MRLILSCLILLSLVGCARTPSINPSIDQRLYELDRIINKGGRHNNAEFSAQGNVIKANIRNDILFDFDRYHIKEQFFPVIQRLAVYLRRNNNISLVVEGHTDHMGDSNYNQQLSFKRAQAVKNIIVSYGIDRNRIDAVGLGEENLLRGATDLQNRRVEMIFIVDKRVSSRSGSSKHFSRKFLSVSDSNPSPYCLIE